MSKYLNIILFFGILSAWTIPVYGQTCISDSDCSEGQICYYDVWGFDGICRTGSGTGCMTDQYCPPEELCYKVGGELPGRCLGVCKTHCDCPQGWFCYYGKCLHDPKTPVYCCTDSSGQPKDGCQPGRWCFEPSGGKGMCAETDEECESACDCGPAHCCKYNPEVGHSVCVKDVKDPWNPGGTLRLGGCTQGVDPTYCCSDPLCHAGRYAYGLAVDKFACFEKTEQTSSNFCGGAPCFSACDCEPGESCIDTYAVGMFCQDADDTGDFEEPPRWCGSDADCGMKYEACNERIQQSNIPAGSICNPKGGKCVSNAVAEAVYGNSPAELLPCCSKGCFTGQKCEFGWKQEGPYLVQRVVGICGSCGNVECDDWESFRTCPEDCNYCPLEGPDGRCEEEEILFNICHADCGYCGDGSCSGWKTPKNCPVDCPEPICGDHSCDVSEVSTCPEDCVCSKSADFIDYPSYCGDGWCDPSSSSLEDCVTCKNDCGADCPLPNVTNDATTYLRRTYQWNIGKEADQSALTLALNQSSVINYAVSMTETHMDGDWGVNGNISILNPSITSTVINNVLNEISGIGSVDVDCGVKFPYTLAYQETLFCTYSTNLPDASIRTSTSKVIIPKLGGTSNVESEANINFANTTFIKIDDCAAVADDKKGNLETVCDSAAPKTLTYSLFVGPYTSVGEYTFLNTASFTTNTTNTSGSSNWAVNVNVPSSGCTLTLGYWKNHAGFGPQPNMVAKLLPIWLGASSGAQSFLVSTDSQAITILGNSGNASNGINKLYAQLLGAKLNISNGADRSAALSTIAEADAFLATKMSTDWSSLSKAQKIQVLTWMTALDNFNNGLIGPGHCSK